MGGEALGPIVMGTAEGVGDDGMAVWLSFGLVLLVAEKLQS